MRYQKSDDSYRGYDAPITVEDVENIRSFGRHSINELSNNSEFLQSSKKWAHKFYKELGVKSPFFRAWFGDWRAYDTGETHVISNRGATSLANGRATNKDTGTVMSWNAHDILRETAYHAAREKISTQAIYELPSIIEGAVLLDTYVSQKSSKSKMPHTAFMHSFYTVYKDGNQYYLLKLYAEQSLSNNEKDIFTRAYQLKDIEKVANLPNGVSETFVSLSGDKSATTISIFYLLDFVNRYFPDIFPESVLQHYGHTTRPDGVLGGSALSQKAADSAKEVRYSKNTDNKEMLHIKDQINAHQDELNAMEVVAFITSNGRNGRSNARLQKDIMESLKSKGLDIEVKGFGKIKIDERRVGMALEYCTTDAEIAVFDTIHRVLKRGIRREEHADHKNRKFETVTFMAPVELNGKHGNVGIVVKHTSGWMYKAHRIILPDGTAFTLDSLKTKEESEMPTDEGHGNKAVQFSPIISDSTDSISDSEEKSNTSGPKIQ